MPNAARVEEDVASGKKLVDGALTVRVNNRSLAYLSSKNAGGVAVVAGSTTVSAENKPAARKADLMADGNSITTGSLDVFIGDDIDIDIPSNAALVAGEDVDVSSPGAGAAHIKQKIAEGVFTPREIKALNRASQSVVAKESNAIPPPSTAPLSTDCGNIRGLIDNLLPGQTIDDIKLTSQYTLKALTRSPYVTFDHALREGQAGLSFEQVLCNLKLVAQNCIEPTKAQYPSLFITNTWRPFQGNPKSQHPLGQAADLQFRQIAPSEYYNIAVWMKNNISFDQLLLEYKTTGSRLPWIHVSFSATNNRRQVLTLLNDVTYSQGLTQLM
jgi:uncharacterized Zn-binding protein involved in type VI secretion